MPYNPTNWLDHLTQYPDRYTLVANGDGTYTITPSFGAVHQEGTPLSAAKMNNIEQGIVVHLADTMPHRTTDPITNKVYKYGIAVQNGEVGILLEEVI